MDRLERGVSGGFIVFDLERFTWQPKDGERMIGVAARGLLVLDSEIAIYAARRRGRPSSPHYLCSSFAVCGHPAAATSSTAGPATASSPTRMDR